LTNDKLGSEAIQVLDWIEHNRHRLPGEVRGPILMELSIPDDFVAAVVDKVLPKGTQTAFVVETQEALTMLRVCPLSASCCRAFLPKAHHLDVT
jgi:hypothetical protein